MKLTQPLQCHVIMLWTSEACASGFLHSKTCSALAFGSRFSISLSSLFVTCLSWTFNVISYLLMLRIHLPSVFSSVLSSAKAFHHTALTFKSMHQSPFPSLLTESRRGKIPPCQLFAILHRFQLLITLDV